MNNTRIQYRLEERQNPPDPARLGKTILSDLDLVNEFNQIKRHCPELALVTQQLTKYLTDLIPDLEDVESSLLHKCIEAGVHMWDECEKTKDDIQRHHNYMRGLVLYLPETLEWCISTEQRRGNNIWDPLNEGLSDWWKRQQAPLCVQRRERPWDPSWLDIGDDNYRLIALIRIIADHDMQVLQGNIDYIIGRTSAGTLT